LNYIIKLKNYALTCSVRWRKLLTLSKIYAKRKNKYNSIRVNYDGHWFDSKAECNRYKKLVLMQASGVISDLILQPKFLLSDTIKYKGITYRKRQYKADFQYIENGEKVVEDVKSKATANDKTYRLKKHIFLEKYGLFYDFREVIY